MRAVSLPKKTAYPCLWVLTVGRHDYQQLPKTLSYNVCLVYLSTIDRTTEVAKSVDIRYLRSHTRSFEFQLGDSNREKYARFVLV